MKNDSSSTDTSKKKKKQVKKIKGSVINGISLLEFMSGKIKKEDFLKHVHEMPEFYDQKPLFEVKSS